MNRHVDIPVMADPLLERYHQDGFAVIPDAISPAEVDALRAEALKICRGERGEVEGMTPAGADEPDDVTIRKYICIHNPHKISPLTLEALSFPRVVDALTQIIGPDVKAMQSMLFTKGEGRPGQAWHQDEYFIPTRDRSLTAAWIALDDATVENGCLWVIPGSHRPGVIYPDREHDDVRFDCTVEAFDFPYSDDEAVAVEIPAGTALLFNGYLLHRSLPNTGLHGMRRAYVGHYMSAQSLLPWEAPIGEPVHVGKYDWRDIVMIAGKDPYAYKGLETRTWSQIREDRDGGCGR